VTLRDMVMSHRCYTAQGEGKSSTMPACKPKNLAPRPLYHLLHTAAAVRLQIMGFLETKRYQGFKETGSVSDTSSQPHAAALAAALPLL
jgi:hypothetical protein